MSSSNDKHIAPRWVKTAGVLAAILLLVMLGHLLVGGNLAGLHGATGGS